MGRPFGQSCGHWAKLAIPGASARAQEGFGREQPSTRHRRPEPACALRRGRGRGGVNLTAYAGHATALLGRNGAGKSTTMRVLAGVVPPTAGLAMVAGYDVRTQTLEVKRAVGYCPDVGGLVPRATPWEHLSCPRGCAGSATGRTGPATCSSGSVATRPPRHHRLLARHGPAASVCLAALHEPQVLLLDEPFDGVDPIGVDATFDVINDARARGACVLVSTHLRELAVQACT